MSHRLLIRALMLCCLSAALPAAGGALFDDYLNYARLGEKCLPGSDQAPSTVAAPLGQSFRVAPGTGEIYRIGVYADSDPQSWGDGEAVTLRLYDTPSKSALLGSFTIDSGTCRTQGLKGRENDRLLLFPLRASLGGQQSLYFELKVSGGDGSVRFRKAADSGYANGAAYLNGAEQPFDVAFETHIKPIADRVANLKSFFARFDLDLPALSLVKAAVEAGDYEVGITEMVKHFRGRSELFEPSIMDPKPDPSFDRTSADRFLAGRLWSGEGEKLVELPWRAKSYWSPEYLCCGREFEPNIYGWNMERTLWGAYSATGDERFARAGMDYRIQWVLDNCPSPKITGIESSHQIWNELVANGRAPGHLPYVFSRVFKYNGFTNDEQLIYFMNWYDNAEYLLDSTVGGNWLAQTATGAYSFGRDFPEFKLKDRFMNWGAEKLIDVTLETVRGDGTQHEASIKYHAMVARRLKDLLNDYQRGIAPLDAKVVPLLKQNLARMYDWMAHTLQPNGYVVMCGDSWYEDYREELTEVARGIGRQDFLWIATMGKEGAAPQTASRAFPDGGYYIMRSDFGEGGKAFTDARQLFVHNGGWVGGHGHWDLLSVNIYAYGRTLVVDPGGMWDPPDGSSPYYWKSNVHSMLVPNNWDCKRDPGPTQWVSSDGYDYLEGIHFGYRNVGIPTVERRIVFVKPDYWVVMDSAASDTPVPWEQVWNVLATDVSIDKQAGTVSTTHSQGGNILIAQARRGVSEITQRKAHVPMDSMRETTVVGFRSETDSPRYTTLVYPYKGAVSDASVVSLKQDGQPVDRASGVIVERPAQQDVVLFGAGPGAQVSVGGAKHTINGDLGLVRIRSGAIVRYSCANAVRLVSGGRELLRSGNPTSMLDVGFDGGEVDVQVREDDPSIVVWIGDAKVVRANGRRLDTARAYKGYLRLFPSEQKAIVVDDSSSGFERVTQTTEWETLSNENAWGLSYTCHETDPGRHEEGRYSASIPSDGPYTVEVFIPSTTRRKTDSMRYTVHAWPDKASGPTKPGGVVKSAQRQADGGYAMTIDQTVVEGKWVRLGEYALQKGLRTIISAANYTETDGLFPAFDAIRLTPVGKSP